MGLILSAANAIGSTLSDQWKEYFYCDAIPSNVICKKGYKKNNGIGNLGSDDVITDGSKIAVADGQCMLIVEQGQVVDICAEPGLYEYRSEEEPSIFLGSLDESVKNIFNTIGKRFQFGGPPAQNQRVYYFNTKELTGNKYGTANPVPFRIVDPNAGIDMDAGIKCFGEYSLKVVDPVLFYTNVCANVEDQYTTADIDSTLKTELLTALQPALAKLGGIRYSEIPLHTTELADSLNEILSSKWRETRGIEISSIGVSSITLNEEDEKKIKELQSVSAYKDPTMAAANITSATADAMRDAANNAGGAAVGFMGMNMAQNASGVDVNSLYAQGKMPNETKSDAWSCPKCGTENYDNFCSSCGTARPSDNKWICPKCGKQNNDRFCTNCGTPKE